MMKALSNIESKKQIILYFILGFIFIISYFSGSILARNVSDPNDSLELEKFMDQFLKEKMVEYHVPGAAFVLVKNGQIYFSKGYGYADIENKVPIDPDKTIFRVASVSKLFTITGVLQLAEQGLIDLNQNVNYYLQDWQVDNAYNEPIRIRYLLTHTDGFETRDLATFIQNPEDLRQLGEILQDDLKSPVQEPGSRITYGGYGSALAGYLVEQVTDVRFEDYIAEKIFQPLEMNKSNFYQILPETLAKDVVKIYNFNDETDEYEPTQFLYVRTPPTGGLSTTANDMAKFLMALLNKGQWNGEPILGEEMTGKIFQKQYSPHPSLGGVTYGFMEYFYNGQRGLIRDGSGVGVRSQIFLLPEENIGYFYVQNIRGDRLVEDLNQAFLDYYYPSGKEPLVEQSYVSQNLQRFEGNFRPAQNPEHTFVKLEAFVLGELKISANDDQTLTVKTLGAEEVYGGFEKVSQWVEVEPLLFRRTDVEKYMAFQEDAEGKIVSVTSGSGYHGNYVKIRWFESQMTQYIFLGFFLVAFVLNITVGLIVLIVNRMKNKRKPTFRVSRLYQTANLISLLSLIGVIGVFYALFFKRIAGFPAFAFGVSTLAVVMLTILVIASVLSIFLLIFYILAWQDRNWSMIGRIYYLIFMIVVVGFILWLNYWNLLGYNY